jgi:hypothetical protein
MRYCPPHAAPRKAGYPKNSKRIPKPLKASSSKKKKKQIITKKVFDKFAKVNIGKHIDNDIQDKNEVVGETEEASSPERSKRDRTKMK